MDLDKTFIMEGFIGIRLLKKYCFRLWCVLWRFLF